MHAGFPCFNSDIQQVMKLGTIDKEVPEIVDLVGGKLLAGGMAVLLKLGFGYIMRDCALDKELSRKAMDFFEENFVFIDPNAPGGKQYYQGKFLIRTRKPGDHMNVLLEFCPNPDDLFTDSPFGRTINSLSLVKTDVLSEGEADKIAQDPDKVDLVIAFRDIDSILGLIGRDNVDIVGLLLENMVQLTGNVGHLFKLGAIAKNIEISLGLTRQAA